MMIKAEDSYVSTFRFLPPSSEALIKASRTIRYWNLRITKHNKKQVSEKTLQQAQEESGVTDFTTTLEEATACRITARAALKK